MLMKQLRIGNEQGFHVRPAQLFADQAMAFESIIQVKNEQGEAANAKSMLELMTLGIAKGDLITIEADGTDEQAALDSLVQLIEQRFGED